MNKQPVYNWDDELGLAICALEEDGNVFYGMAQCHPDDSDMKSQKTGLEIAHRRAIIQAIRHKINNELKPQLAILKETYYTMKHSSKFQPKSYENKMLQRKLKQIELDLATFKDMLNAERASLRNLINEKDEFYKKIRSGRNQESIIKVYGQK
jgi:flagellar motility protein MotE (MotC chaperone)